MTGRITGVLAGFLAIQLTAACDIEDVADVEADDVELRETVLNTVFLNTVFLNTVFLNGFSLNGTLTAPSGDYIQMELVELHPNGASAAVWLDGSNLHVEKTSGAIVSGTQLDKARFVYTMVDGGKYKQREVRVAAVIPPGPGSDLWLYHLEIKENDQGWGPLCRDASGAATQAIILGGLWSPQTGARAAAVGTPNVTFACRGAALAKCAEYGYRPWASAGGGSLVDHHQACTRMVRADYCGDGVGHTVDGTPIHVVDTIGVQNVDPNATYAVEAEWSPTGATCLNPGNTRLPNQQIACNLPACGASFASGGLIQSGKVVAGP